MKQIQGKQDSRHREVWETEGSRNRDSTVGITEGQKKIISLSYKSLHSRDSEIHFHDENPKNQSILYRQGGGGCMQ